MKFRLLGPFEAQGDGPVIEIAQYRQRSLLALLLIQRGRVLSTERIIESLWGGEHARMRHNALWIQVSKLRSALEPGRPNRSQGSYIETTGSGYRFRIEGNEIDADRFEALSRRGRELLASNPEAASRLLGEALGLWRGRALDDFDYEPFAQDEIRRLEALRRLAVEDRIDADLACGVGPELIPELEALVRRHPFNERLAGQLMTALHRAGRHREVERTFQALTDRLEKEFGIGPSQSLVRSRAEALTTSYR